VSNPLAGKSRSGSTSTLLSVFLLTAFCSSAASAQRTPAPAASATPAPPAAAPAASKPAPAAVDGGDPSSSDAGAKPKGGPGGGAFQGGGPGGGRGRRGGPGGGGSGDKPEKTAYDYYLPGPDGKDVPLSDFKGKYILVVNVARKSSYAEQLPALVKLADADKDKGLVVIAVPSNEFGAAEPGTNADIQKAYADAKVDFRIMGVSKLTGDDELPFFTYLTKGSAVPAGGNVHWNYTKFVIDKTGKVIARFEPDVAPDSLEMRATMDEILAGTYKPKGAGGGKGGAGGDAAGDDTN